MARYPHSTMMVWSGYQREEIEHEERRQADGGVYRDTRMDVWSSSHMVQPGS